MVTDSYIISRCAQKIKPFNREPVTICHLSQTDDLPPALLSGLTLPPLRVERGGYVWDEAQRANVWREDAVTVTVYERTKGART